MKPKRPRISYRKTYYLVLWWMSQTPYAAISENEVAAEAAANVRNALMVTISGRDAKVDTILDWYRRDESGRPMPAEWRGPPGPNYLPRAPEPQTPPPAPRPRGGPPPPPPLPRPRTPRGGSPKPIRRRKKQKP